MTTKFPTIWWTAVLLVSKEKMPFNQPLIHTVFTLLRPAGLDTISENDKMVFDFISCTMHEWECILYNTSSSFL